MGGWIYRSTYFCILSLDGCERIASRQDRSNSKVRASYTYCIRCWVVPRTGLGNEEREKKSRSSEVSNSDPWSVHPATGCYTDCTTPGPVTQNVIKVIKILQRAFNGLHCSETKGIDLRLPLEPKILLHDLAKPILSSCSNYFPGNRTSDTEQNAVEALRVVPFFAEQYCFIHSIDGSCILGPARLESFLIDIALPWQLAKSATTTS
jgi:hypothetical protein